jgi:hypothetical protein
MSHHKGRKHSGADKPKKAKPHQQARHGDPQTPIFQIGDPAQAQFVDPRHAHPGDPRWASYNEIIEAFDNKFELKRSRNGTLMARVQAHSLAPISVAFAWLILVLGGAAGGYWVSRMLADVGPAWIAPSTAFVTMVGIIRCGWRAVRSCLSLAPHRTRATPTPWLIGEGQPQVESGE